MSRSSFLVLSPIALALGMSAFAADPPATGTGDAAPTTTPAPATGLTDAEKAAAAEGEFRRELLTAEQDVDKLKERTFRSKATLQLLKELVLEGSSLGSSVVLYHVNQMGSGYTVEEVRYFLDGKNVYAKNLLAFLETMFDKKTKALAINWDDEIIKGTLIAKGGKIVHPNLQPKA